MRAKHKHIYTGHSVTPILISIILAYVAMCCTPLHAGSSNTVFGNAPSITEVTANTPETTRISLTVGALDHFTVETAKGIFTELLIPGGHSVGKTGTPKLPAIKKLIEVPINAAVQVKVLHHTKETHRLSDIGITHPLMPVQPSLRKDQKVSEVPFVYHQEYYNTKSAIEPTMASVEVLGVLRGQRIGRLTVAPLHYHPADGTITVYNNIELEISYSGSDHTASARHKAATWSPWFDVVYQQVINPSDTRSILDDHPDLTKYPVKMVVVSHPDFKETLQPFIQWKTIKGFEVIEAYTDVIGETAAEIKTFVHGQYNAATPGNPAPTFLLLVGDTGKLPASATGTASGQVTDLYYATVNGTWFPDMYYGRLSARNEQELQNQLDKILYYQQYAFDDPSFLNDVTLIAGADTYWNPRVGQPTVTYGTTNYFHSASGFVNVNAYLSSYAGCYDADRIAVSLINYSAHCSPTSWGNPLLTVAGVHNLTNAGQYPLAIGNCCQSAMFSEPESIGEAWMRAANKGSVAYIGSAPNTHWFEDFYWAVGAFPIQGNNNGYVPSVEETTTGVYDALFASTYYPVAAKKFVGNLAITQAHLAGYNTHSNAQWYWEGYHTLGDPSTIIYMTEGSENTISHPSFLTAGEPSFMISALPGSYAAISRDGILLGAAFVDDSGKAYVPVSPAIDYGEATIVVTKPQYVPYIVTVPVTQDNTHVHIASDEDKSIDNYECFEGVQTLTVAGQGNFFRVEAGGSVTLVAGESIHLLPGVTVKHGGYMHAYITDDGVDCTRPVAEFKEPPVRETTTRVIVPQHKRSDTFFTLYPNPTSGEFTLELSDAGQDVPVITVEIFSIEGVRTFTGQLPAQQKHHLTLDGQRPGIYFVRVTKDTQTGIRQIIKHH